MTQASLFGHIAINHYAHPENIATEALNYILQSKAAQKIFLKYLAAAGIDLPDDIHFTTQFDAGGQNMVDLVGLDNAGQPIFMVEAKFWAGLTSNQPVGYLQRLPDTGGTLLFLTPETRLPTLWPRLLWLCDHSDLMVDALRTPNKGITLGSLNDMPHKQLGITSWRSVLESLVVALQSEGDTIGASDVLQLQGLCEQMDTDAFLPLQPDEVSSANGRRITQYIELVQDMINHFRQVGVITNLKNWTGGYDYTGKYFDIVSVHDCFLQVNFRIWGQYHDTPLWLRIKSNGHTTKSLEILKRNGMLFRDDAYLFIPLFLPVGVEQDEVLADLLRQAEEVFDLLLKKMRFTWFR
jgi:hypothetical protein